MYNFNLKNINTIIFDFDETLYRSIEGALLSANYMYNLNLQREDLYKVRTWNFNDVIDITKEQVEEVFASKMFFDLLKPYDSMINAMKWFKSMGKEIVILSLGTPMNLHYKSKFIHENLNGVYDYLILAGSEDNLKMDKKIFNYNKGCVLIDDNQSNLFTTTCEHKILSRLYTDEETEWGKDWIGLSVRSGQELINLFY